MMGSLLIVIGLVVLGIVAFPLILIARRAMFEARWQTERRRLHRQRLLSQIDLLRLKFQVEEKIVQQGWNGHRKFFVKNLVKENSQVTSVYLYPHDARSIPPYYPGQFLTFQFHYPGQQSPVIRCYSLSSSPKADYYRISVKKALPPQNVPDAPPGLVSSLINDQLKVGDIIDVRSPRGNFFVDLYTPAPVVLIGGGIGITPILSMLEAIAACNDGREVWLFYGVRNNKELVFAEEIRRMTESRPNIHLNFCFNEPNPEDAHGKDFHHKSHVTVDLMKEVLPGNCYDFFLCGPPPMMDALRKDLAKWGVQENKIHYEAFGAGTVKKVAASAATTSRAEVAARKVNFVRSNKIVDWKDATQTLLDLADANQVAIASGCRAGNCGTCVVAVKSGRVKTLQESGFITDAGSCLVCISVPEEDLEIDA